VPLNDRYYILKSFGSDQSDNHVGGPEDISASHLPTVAESAPEVTEVKDLAQIGMFPSVTILGAKPEKGLLRARIIVNKITAKRYLLVQNPKQPNFEMVAPMSKVEEFLWLPSGYEIAFTVAGDDIYKDGVYLWNLMTNEVQPIGFDGDANKSPFTTVGDESYFLSLSGISATRARIYVFAKKVRKVTLDPREFYHKENLYEIEINNTPYAKRKLKKVTQPWTWNGLTQKLSHAERIRQPFTGNPAQLRWLQLPLVGGIDTIITEWQDLVVHLTESALFPYGLWWLGSLYGEAAQDLQESNAKDAQSLRAYGIEMSKALAELAYAPRYLQGFATHLNTMLSEDRPMPYTVTDFDGQK
jgi:hypothetical protein